MTPLDALVAAALIPTPLCERLRLASTDPAAYFKLLVEQEAAMDARYLANAGFATVGFTEPTEVLLDPVMYHTKEHAVKAIYSVLKTRVRVPEGVDMTRVNRLIVRAILIERLDVEGGPPRGIPGASHTSIFSLTQRVRTFRRGAALFFNAGGQLPPPLAEVSKAKSGPRPKGQRAVTPSEPVVVTPTPPPPPPVTVTAPPPVTVCTLPPAWTPHEDPYSDYVYYVNEATGERQWEQPQAKRALVEVAVYKKKGRFRIVLDMDEDLQHAHLVASAAALKAVFSERIA